MKIYPSPFQIIEKEKIQYGEIPLAKFDHQNMEETVSTQKIFNHVTPPGENWFLDPYEMFDDPDPMVYDLNGKQVFLGDNMVRVGTRYSYVPRGSVEFTPERVSYKGLVKKNMSHNPSLRYDFRVGAESSVDFAEKLHTIFGDAGNRGICPRNIMVNGQDLSHLSLLDVNSNDLDFLFIESGPDISEHLTTIDNMMKKRNNVWLMIDTEEGSPEYLLDPTQSRYSLRHEILYAPRTRNSPEDIREFNATSSWEQVRSIIGMDFEWESFFLQSVRTPVLIMKKEGHGFVVLSDKKVLDYLDNRDMYETIYSVMTYIIFNSWYLSYEKNHWLTDNPVEHIALKVGRYDRSHPEILLNSFAECGRYNIDRFQLQDLFFESPREYEWHIDGDEVRIAKKENNRDDRVKPEELTSVYTTRHTVMYFARNIVRKEEGLGAQVIRKTDGHYVRLMPGVSSTRKLKLKQSIDFRISEFNREYFIVGEHNTFELIKSKRVFHDSPVNLDGPDDYATESEENTHKHYLHRVEALIKPFRRKIDMRLMGGGLPKHADPDYGLWDIGNPAGRPYRKGAAVVVKLPRECEQYKDIIAKSVQKHQSATDEIVFVIDEDR